MFTVLSSFKIFQEFHLKKLGQTQWISPQEVLTTLVLLIHNFLRKMTIMSIFMRSYQSLQSQLSPKENFLLKAIKYQTELVREEMCLFHLIGFIQINQLVQDSLTQSEHIYIIMVWYSKLLTLQTLKQELN